MVFLGTFILGSRGAAEMETEDVLTLLDQDMAIFSLFRQALGHGERR